MRYLGAHCKQPNKLPKEFADFIDQPESKGIQILHSYFFFKIKEQFSLPLALM